MQDGTENSTRNLLVGIYASLIVLAILIYVISTGGKSVPNQMDSVHQQPPGTIKMSLDEAMKLAIQEHQAGRLDKAEEIYRQILTAAPNNPYVLHFLGLVAFQKGNIEPAYELIQKAISFNPGQPDFHSNLGNALIKMGRGDEAISAYKEALKLDRNHADALGNLGFALQGKKSYSHAAACYQEALKINPNHGQVKINYEVLMKEHPGTVSAKECPR